MKNLTKFGAASALVLMACAGMAFGADREEEGAASSKAFDLQSMWRIGRDAHLEFFPDAKYDPTSMLIMWKAETTEETRAAVRKALSVETLETWALVPGLEHVYVPGDVDEVMGLATKLGDALGAIEFVEPDYFYTLIATPNDTYYGLLWGMNNTGQTVNNDPGSAGADIDANLAWDVSTGSTTMVVGMADSGFRSTHEDLAANRWTNPGETAGNKVDDDGNGYIDDTWGWDFWNGDKDPTDDNGHGTHTAGTVGAVGNNGKGVTGVCWTVRLAGLKIGSRTGSVSSTAGISAINYCVTKGIKVSNHSWGGTGFSSAFDAAVTNAKTAGHMLVCAAGNSSINNDVTPFYPASYTQDNIISVASIDNNDALSSFSNYGATRVDLGAPGSTIASTYISRNSNNTYAYLSGTSMAAPHVTGATALVWSVNPTWTYSQVRTKILSTVRPVSSLSGKTVTGGVLNANNAVR